MLVSPAVLFFVLRLRLMAPIVLPDPAMHTIYVVDPRDFFARFSSELAPISGIREGERVGFLVPARLSYLAFGAVPGFVVFRYVLALVAVVPSYELLRRLYGRAAGVLAIVVVMSSPVLVTAWGTDYPDSAVVSYLAGGLACLAMPCGDRRRPAWLAIAAGLMAMAVWSNVAAAPLVAATMLAYCVITFWRERRRLLADALVLAASAAVVTGALMVASGVLLGPYDYILPTIRAYTFLSSPGLVSHYHSTNRAWILLRPYLLVPAAVVAAWAAAFVRRLHSMPTPQLLIGTTCAAQVAAFSYLQFLGDAETLEQHYYSSSLWAAVCLCLAVTISALAKPLFEHPVSRWWPALVVLAVPLAFEADPHAPSFGWLPTGVSVVAVVTFAAVIGRFVADTARPAAARVVTGAVIAIVVASCLVLTVAPYERHVPLSGTIADPVPAYAAALGGGVGSLVEQYRVATELPGFVGNSTYPSERLLMWYPWPQVNGVLEMMGMYHAGYNSLPSSPPTLTSGDQTLLAARKPAEILIFNTPSFSLTLHALAPYDPSLVRTTVLRSGSYHVEVWLVSLGVYVRTRPDLAARELAAGAVRRIDLVGATG